MRGIEKEASGAECSDLPVVRKPLKLVLPKKINCELPGAREMEREGPGSFVGKEEPRLVSFIFIFYF